MKKKPTKKAPAASTLPRKKKPVAEGVAKSAQPSAPKEKKTPFPYSKLSAENRMKIEEALKKQRENFRINPKHPSEEELDLHEESLPAPEDQLFDSKFFPRANIDANYALARLAASNLPKFAFAIEVEARANNRKFFIELGKALDPKARPLWDKLDFRIATELHQNPKLSRLNEEQLAVHFDISTTAMDKRLQRLKVFRGKRKKSSKT